MTSLLPSHRARVSSGITADTPRDLAFTAPARVTLTLWGPTASDWDGESTYQVLLNPASLRVSHAAEWPRQPVIGLSYEPTQYSRTKNAEVACQFYVSEFEVARQRLSNRVGVYGDAFRRFLLSLLYPVNVPAVHGQFQEPHQVVFSWPNLVTFRAVLESVAFDYQRMARDGTPLVYTADCKFMEAAVDTWANAVNSGVRRIPWR